MSIAVLLVLRTFALRDYGTATWEGGDAGCDHTARYREADSPGRARSTLGGGKGTNAENERSKAVYRSVCGKCGARRVDQQIGLEATPEQYVARLVEVFREVRRILHPTGVLFLNLGDSYASSGPKSNNNGLGASTLTTGTRMERRIEVEEAKGKNIPHALPPGLKPKDLIGIPWMTAFALRADGWWLRQEIIWHKLAPMPESVTDRCTKAHEQVFLLAKSERYYFDAEAIKEPFADERMGNPGPYKWSYAADPITGVGVRGRGGSSGKLQAQGWNADGSITGRNKRSVWTLGPESYSGAHYATFPTKLVEPCVLSGTSAHGCCSKCGSPWERVVERTREHGLSDTSFPKTDGLDKQNGHKRLHQRVKAARAAGEPHDNPLGGTVTLGWAATCTCGADVVPAVVLDPFCGSGTTLAVALKFGRRAIGIDLDPRNEILATQRIEQTQPLLLLEVT